jgi:hypothetical protein
MPVVCRTGEGLTLSGVHSAGADRQDPVKEVPTSSRQRHHGAEVVMEGDPPCFEPGGPVLVRWRPALRVLAVALPLLTCALLALVRDQLTAASSVLVLVVWVVAAAATGDRVSGVLAAVSGALWFASSSPSRTCGSPSAPPTTSRPPCCSPSASR